MVAEVVRVVCLGLCCPAAVGKWVVLKVSWVVFAGCDGCVAGTCFLAVEYESVEKVFAASASLDVGRLVVNCSCLPSA